jgi:hypothetical protein
MVDKYYDVEKEMFGDVGVDSDEDGGDQNIEIFSFNRV